MTNLTITAAVIFTISLMLPIGGLHSIWAAVSSPVSPTSPVYAGSSSCRECHEKFYKLWSTSIHGLAMQPYTPEFAGAKLTLQPNDVVIGKFKYRTDVDNGVVLETGPKGKQKYPIEHVLGGKNVYYFLTPFKKGRLQTLPVAYDVNKKEWFDTLPAAYATSRAGRGARPPAGRNLLIPSTPHVTAAT
jgi:hypothetical protein